MKSLIKLNNKYGRLTVIQKTGTQNQHSLFECFCECGVIVVVKGIHLMNGHTKSCGCFMREETTRRNLAKGKSVFSIGVLIAGGYNLLIAGTPQGMVIGIICMIYHYLLVLDVRNDVIEAKLDILLPPVKKEDESNR